MSQPAAPSDHKVETKYDLWDAEEWYVARGRAAHLACPKSARLTLIPLTSLPSLSAPPDPPLPVPACFRNKAQRPGTLFEIVKKRFQEDPLVPIFSFAAAAALIGGMNQSFVKKDPVKANRYMIARVSCQGIAAAACVYSVYKLTANPANPAVAAAQGAAGLPDSAAVVAAIKPDAARP